MQHGYIFLGEGEKQDEFNAYKLIHTELDKRIDLLLEEYEEKRQNLKELTKSKRCGFHAEKEN